MREHTTTIDVSDQYHRAINRFGETHVGDVAVAQVDLSRAACAFNQHHVILPSETFVGFKHCRHRARLVVVIVARIHVGACLAVNDDLRTHVGVRLQQHRVHVGVRREAGGLRLQGLRAADFATVTGDSAVERHVLWLERHH